LSRDTGSQPQPQCSLGHRGSEEERTAFGPLGPIRSLGAQSLEGSRPTDLGGASWVAASATPDMSSEDPALQPPVLEPCWNGDGEGHPHPGMFETDRSVTQSRRHALIVFCRISMIMILTVRCLAYSCSIGYAVSIDTGVDTGKATTRIVTTA